MCLLFIDKKILPKAANDIKLINAGKILENNKTVGQCKVPFGELKGVITMHVVVQPSLAKSKTGLFYLEIYCVIISYCFDNQIVCSRRLCIYTSSLLFDIIEI
jgi:hypothetical protein